MRNLLTLAVMLALLVVPLGAYVRLSNAGLGCPDWPGCYGKLVGVPVAAPEKAAAVLAFPGKPVEPLKAWKEMIHRYAAGTLALLILAIALRAWSARERERHSPLLPTLLLGLVLCQALLGMWTVTLLLKPVIVTAHLVGGMATAGLLLWLRLREGLAGVPAATPTGVTSAGGNSGGTISAGATSPRVTSASASAPLASGLLALAAVALQIGLGGWVSSHYAALACPDFPACRDGSWTPVDPSTAIHLLHRAGALVVALAVGAFALNLWRRGRSGLALLLGAAVCLQIGLGIANVVLRLPLPIAVAHNGGAALLLLALVATNAAVRASFTSNLACSEHVRLRPQGS